MDSYSSYRDTSARSPSDGTYSLKKRTRDEEQHIPHREQSIKNYPRARIRSRLFRRIDEYDPRFHHDDRDGDGRMNPPPANMGLCGPGKGSTSPASLTMGSLENPARLPYQVGFPYFEKWWRINKIVQDDKARANSGHRRESEAFSRTLKKQESRYKEAAEIQAAYNAYKEELQAKSVRSFVSEHREEQWFKEKYVPKFHDMVRGRLNDIRRGAYIQWEQDLELGTFDKFSLEGIFKSDSNDSSGEANTSNEILGAADLVSANGGNPRDENQLQPTLLIKTIAPHISRQNLETLCKENLGEEEGGFKWLSLSDPIPRKNYHRIGWVMLHPASETNFLADRTDLKNENGDVRATTTPHTMSTVEHALKAIDGKLVRDEVCGDFVCHVTVYKPPHNPRKKALWGLFSAPERIERDLLLVQRLVNKFEEEFDPDFQAILKVQDKVDGLRNSECLQSVSPAAPPKTKDQYDIGLNALMDDEDGMVEEDGEEQEVDGLMSNEADDEDMLAKKKQLDILIEYLRRVFNFCYFCVFESDSAQKLMKNCPGHLRQPKSRLSISSRIVARASANGEPFPRKGTANAKGDAGRTEGDEKVPHAPNNEQRLIQAYNWTKALEDKIMLILEPRTIDIRKFGGRPIEEALEQELTKYVKQEDEQMWRCKAPGCSKLFQDKCFWKKHMEKRHDEFIKSIRQEFELINFYVMDPARVVPYRTDFSIGHPPAISSQIATGLPREYVLQNQTNGRMRMLVSPLTGLTYPPIFSTRAEGWNPLNDDQSSRHPIRRGNNTSTYGLPHVGHGDHRGYGTDGYQRRDRPCRAFDGSQEVVQGLSTYEDLNGFDGEGGGELKY